MSERIVNWNCFSPAAVAYISELIKKDSEQYGTTDIPGPGEGTSGSQGQTLQDDGRHQEDERAS